MVKMKICKINHIGSKSGNFSSSVAARILPASARVLYVSKEMSARRQAMGVLTCRIRLSRDMAWSIHRLGSGDLRGALSAERLKKVTSYQVQKE